MILKKNLNVELPFYNIRFERFTSDFFRSVEKVISLSVSVVSLSIK